nr:hypothetical protein Iba_chr13fCG8810 [Ipomoea batatas]GME11590.1 hypothetical protein Iba_scaffold11965CG0020 [Ipomoea batatas]
MGSLDDLENMRGIGDFECMKGSVHFKCMGHISHFEGIVSIEFVRSKSYEGRHFANRDFVVEDDDMLLGICIPHSLLHDDFDSGHEVHHNGFSFFLPDRLDRRLPPQTSAIIATYDCQSDTNSDMQRSLRVSDRQEETPADFNKRIYVGFLRQLKKVMTAPLPSTFEKKEPSGSTVTFVRRRKRRPLV